MSENVFFTKENLLKIQFFLNYDQILKASSQLIFRECYKYKLVQYYKVELTITAIQYGFVTLFLIGFPLAPLFALINNLIEIQVDSHKILATRRRSYQVRAHGIGELPCNTDYT